MEKVQIEKMDVSGKVFWSDVSEPVPPEEAYRRYCHYASFYPHNKYRVVKV